jgi:hypothetical protein
MASIEQVFRKGKQSVSVRSEAPVEAVWALLATPAWWPVWAPHIRRVSGPHRAEAPPPDLETGQHLLVHGPWPVALRAEITHLELDRRWDFVVRVPGPWRVRNAHLVERAGTGSRITVHLALEGPVAGALTRTVLAAYLPLAVYSLRRLARLADSDHRAVQAALERLGEAGAEG